MEADADELPQCLCRADPGPVPLHAPCGPGTLTRTARASPWSLVLVTWPVKAAWRGCFVPGSVTVCGWCLGAGGLPRVLQGNFSMFVCSLLLSVHFVNSPRICGAFLVAQTVKNLPAMQETCVRSLCREDPLEKSVAAHSDILAWRVLRARGA